MDGLLVLIACNPILQCMSECLDGLFNSKAENYNYKKDDTPDDTVYKHSYHNPCNGYTAFK